MKYLFKMFFPVVVCTTCDSIDHMHACSETRELEGYGDVKLPPKKKKKKKRWEPAYGGHQWTSIFGHCRLAVATKTEG